MSGTKTMQFSGNLIVTMLIADVMFRIYEDSEAGKYQIVSRSRFGDFHDSCSKELHMWSEHFVDDNLSMHVSGGLDHKVRVLFQRQDIYGRIIEAAPQLLEKMESLLATESRQDCNESARVP
jgi:hypothetical protein